jgi:hypothetical protein
MAKYLGRIHPGFVPRCQSIHGCSPFAGESWPVKDVSGPSLCNPSAGNEDLPTLEL